jgi:hypothetical protein
MGPNRCFIKSELAAIKAGGKKIALLHQPLTALQHLAVIADFIAAYPQYKTYHL